MSGNYVKICRSLLTWEWYQNENTFRLFMHCLLKANWKPGRFEGIDVPRGSFVTSLSKLSKELGMSERQVRTALSHLKSTGELTDQSTSRFRIITVNNYDTYQSSDKQPVSQATSKRQASDKQATTIEEGKKERKKENNKKDREVFYPNDDRLDQAFRDYVKMRKDMKAPMTERAIIIAMNKLEKLAVLPFSDIMDNDLAIQIIEESIVHNWKSFYPLKNDRQKKDAWEDA